MALLPGVRAEFNQQQDEKRLYTFDFGKACRNKAGAIVTTITAVAPASTAGIVVGTPTTYPTVATAQVDTSGMSVSTDPYVILLAATLENTDVVNLAIQVNVTAKADTT